MNPEEIFSDINSTAIICVGDDDECLTLTSFREIIATAIMSMKVNYIQSIVNQGYISLVDDVGPSDKILSDGRLTDGEGNVYLTRQTEEPYYVSYSQWFESGENCKILQLGEQWKEGKVRLRVVAEFISDEPEQTQIDRPTESSLDTFRENP